MTLRIVKMIHKITHSNLRSFVIHFGLVLDVVGGAGQQLLDTALDGPLWLGKELGRSRWRCWILLRLHRLLLGLLEVGEGAQGGDLSLLASRLDLLGLGLEEVDGLAALLCRSKNIRRKWW